MKVRKKTLTNQCGVCELKIVDDGEKICRWGESKAKKILVPPLGKRKNCGLILDGVLEDILDKDALENG